MNPNESTPKVHAPSINNLFIEGETSPEGKNGLRLAKAKASMRELSVSARELSRGYKIINSSNIETLDEQWREFLDGEPIPYYGGELADDDLDEIFDDLVDDFCKKLGHSERMPELMHEDPWYVWFKDGFYKECHEQGVLN